MAKKIKTVEFPFYTYLKLFHDENKGRIYTHYRRVTKKFPDFNNPDNPTAYLRPPQFEALEMYVFLKEFCGNRYLYEIFEDWFEKRGRFEGRSTVGVSSKGQTALFSPIEENQGEDKALFQAVFEQIKSFQQAYPNYIFALTMGLGKTVLMATSIFYEFLLANKFPKDKKYCHNVLVFAPDKTVLQSLREIQTFDKSKVVPTEYVNWLETNLKFFFLDDTGTSLNAIENSMFNIVISNTQKIILKKKHKEKTAAMELFEETKKTYRLSDLNQEFDSIYDDEPQSDKELLSNQRFEKLLRLKQMGVYVDEAHHVFGNKLKDDLLNSDKTTSLRATINMLAREVKKRDSHIVGCYNYTGTPYVGNRLLPEVVYSYGLKNAIEYKYLKRVHIDGFENIKDQTLAFVRFAINKFWEKYKNKLFENMKPKMAFFASNIEELQQELRPAVEQVLSELNLPQTKILVNVGDPKITTNDNLRQFKLLDTPGSDKQFILLVNKGKEGWNCRSLFSVALHRKPRSKIFVLQATMRCLRQIGEVQETGLVFLSDENVSILDEELQSNFRLSVDDLNNTGEEAENITVRVVPPPVKIKLKKVRKLHQLQPKAVGDGLNLELEKADTDKYRITLTERSLSDLSKKIGTEEDITYIKEKREFSELTLVAEIARYLNLSPMHIRQVLVNSVQGMDEVIRTVNEFNELLYDWIIPRLFAAFFDILEFERSEEHEVGLVKTATPTNYQVNTTAAVYPKGESESTATDAEDDGITFTFKAKPGMVIRRNDPGMEKYRDKSFHLDTYIFDSKPEKKFFLTLLKDKKVDKVWFTGMLTHGQSDFFIHYVDPESHSVRSYYPDFLVQMADGEFVIVEVKGDHQVEDKIVKAKANYAIQLADASRMRYVVVKGTEAMRGRGLS